MAAAVDLDTATEATEVTVIEARATVMEEEVVAVVEVTVATTVMQLRNMSCPLQLQHLLMPTPKPSTTTP